MLLGISICYINGHPTVELVAEFSQSGIQGNIIFMQLHTNEILIKTNLEWTVAEDPPQFSWKICEFPVDYTQIEDRCNKKKLGNV